MSWMRFCLLLTVFSLLLGGCSRRAPRLEDFPFENREHGLYPGNRMAGEKIYRVGVGDTLSLFVRRHPEFTAEKIRVTAEGELHVPLLLEPVRVTGLTLREVEYEVARLIRPYVRDLPFVRAQLVKSDSRFYYVMGAVNRPGKYPMRDESIFVREALERAGWPLRNAALWRGRLVSSNPDHFQDREIDLKDILYRGDLRQNYAMKPGDILVVPESWASTFTYYSTLWMAPFSALLGWDSMLTQYYVRPSVNYVTRTHSDDDDYGPTDIIRYDD